MRQINKQFLSSTIFIIVTLAYSPSYAAKSDNDFYDEYMRGRCLDTDFVAVPENNFYNAQLCSALYPGGFTGQPTREINIIVPDRLGRNPTSNGLKNQFDQVQIGGLSSSNTVSGGADDGSWGIFLTTLSGETDRKESDLENSFSSDQDGYLIGADYNFSDKVILGLTLGFIEDDTTIGNNGGSSNTDSDSITLYTTWIINDNWTLDAYLGDTDSDIQNTRSINITTVNTISGTITSTTDSAQSLFGVSINYDRYFGAWSVGGFFALDSLETDTNAYNETGRIDNPIVSGVNITGLELSYPSLNTKSETQSIGLRGSYTFSFDWGMLIPNLQITSLKENDDNAKRIDLTLVSAPNNSPDFTIETDAPDRDYMINSYGIIASLNNGAQLFLNIEEWSGHSFLNSDSMNIGFIYPF